MLPLIGLSLAAVFFVLYFSGLLDELAKRAGTTRRLNEGQHRAGRGSTPEDERRLEVFERFLSRLQRPPTPPDDQK